MRSYVRRHQLLISAQQQAGFTLVELMVAMSLSMLISALTLLTVTSVNKVYHFDLARISLNETLRGALDLITTDGREAGENLNDAVPAVLVRPGGSGESDELILRRGLRAEILSLCQNLVKGQPVQEVIFAKSGTDAGCIRTDNLSAFNEWKSFRLDQGGQVRAYIMDIDTKQGDFFDFTLEEDSGSQLRLIASGGDWSRDYQAGAAAVYLLEEWHFYVEDGLLNLIQEGRSNDVKTVADRIDAMEVSVTKNDGTTVVSFTENDLWTEVVSIDLTLSASRSNNGEQLTRSQRRRFFPRNILSN